MSAALAYDDKGERSSLAPLVLLHPFPFDARYWEGVAVSIAKSRRVVTPDLAGFGRSRHLPPRATLDDHARDVAALLDALAIERCVLGGLSMGGYVALAFLEHFASRLAGLVLADTRSAPDSNEGRAGRERSIALVREHGTSALTEGLITRLLAPDASEDVRARARAIADDQAAEGVAAALGAMRDRADRTRLLATVSVPALVIVGEHDALSPPAEMRAIAGAMPNARFVELARVGHLASFEGEAAFTRALERYLETARG